MPAQKVYPRELRERAVRLVLESVAEKPDTSYHQACVLIGKKLGIVPDTLRTWVKQARIDAGELTGHRTGDTARIKALEAENRELKQANEILLAASAFFARELDPRQRP